MFVYFKIHPTTAEILEVLQRQHELAGHNTKAGSAANGKPYLVPVAVTEPPYDADTEVMEGPVDSYDAPSETATRVYTVRAKTAEELNAKLAEYQAAQVALLSKAAAAAPGTEFVSDVLGTPHRYRIDPEAQRKLNGVATSAIRNQATGGWTRKIVCTPDGQDDWRRRDHTATQIMDLGDALIDSLAGVEDNLETLIDQVNVVTITTDLATAVAEVQAITWSA